jgi:hypothetical protein
VTAPPSVAHPSSWPADRCSGCFHRAPACLTATARGFAAPPRLALSTGTTIVPVCLVGGEKALRPGRFKLGLPRIRVIVGEPIEVQATRPSIAAAKALTARLEAAIEDAREPYGPPAHAWYPDEQTA